MNKTITCRMIDGKPVVEYKEEYVPKKGDIVAARDGSTTCLGILSSYCGNIYLLSFSVNIRDCGVDEAQLYLTTNTTLGDDWRISKATPEESEVMHHILNENGYELKGDMVVKKRWIPEIGQLYWNIGHDDEQFVPLYGKKRCKSDTQYLDCFKTEQSAQSACDKLNEFILTLPQE